MYQDSRCLLVDCCLLQQVSPYIDQHFHQGDVLLCRPIDFLHCDDFRQRGYYPCVVSFYCINLFSHSISPVLELDGFVTETWFINRCNIQQEMFVTWWICLIGNILSKKIRRCRCHVFMVYYVAMEIFKIWRRTSWSGWLLNSYRYVIVVGILMRQTCVHGLNVKNQTH